MTKDLRAIGFSHTKDLRAIGFLHAKDLRGIGFLHTKTYTHRGRHNVCLFCERQKYFYFVNFL